MALNANTVVHALLEGKFDSGDFLKRLGYKGGVEELVPRTAEEPGLVRFCTRSSIVQALNISDPKASQEIMRDFRETGKGLTFGIVYDDGITVFQSDTSGDDESMWGRFYSTGLVHHPDYRPGSNIAASLDEHPALTEALFKYLAGYTARSAHDSCNQLLALAVMRQLDHKRMLETVAALVKSKRLSVDVVKEAGFAVRLSLVQAGIVPLESLANDTLIVHGGMPYIAYDDYSDQEFIALFDGKHEQGVAEKIFGGDSYELFWSDYSTPIKDVLNYNSLTPANQRVIKAKLVGKVIVDDDTGNEVVLNRRNINNYELNDLLQELDQQDDDVPQAVVNAYRDAEQSAREDAHHKGYMEAAGEIINGSGKHEWIGDKLCFPTTLAAIAEMADHFSESTGSEFDGNDYRDLVRDGTEERAEGPEDPSYRVDDEYFNERLSELLHDIK